MERAISQAMIRFEKEFMGRGPLETKAYIIEDMVLCGSRMYSRLLSSNWLSRKMANEGGT